MTAEGFIALGCHLRGLLRKASLVTLLFFFEFGLDHGDDGGLILQIEAIADEEIAYEL